MKNVLKKRYFFFQLQHSPRFPEPSVTGNLCFSCSRKKISFTNPSCLPTAPCFYHLLLLLPLQPRTSSKCYKQSAFGLNTHKVLRRNSMKHTRRKICHWSKKLPSKATTPKVTPQHILQNDRLSKMSFSLSTTSSASSWFPATPSQPPSGKAYSLVAFQEWFTNSQTLGSTFPHCQQFSPTEQSDGLKSTLELGEKRLRVLEVLDHLKTAFSKENKLPVCALSVIFLHPFSEWNWNYPLEQESSVKTLVHRESW